MVTIKCLMKLKVIELINLGKENEQIEYKKSTGELDDAMKSISAILNKHGKGKILFGVKPQIDLWKESSLKRGDFLIII